MSNVAVHEYAVDLATFDGKPTYAGFDLIYGETLAHEISITLTNDGEAVDLSSASMSVYVVRGDGTSVLNVGSAVGNVVSATLAEECAAIVKRAYIVGTVIIGSATKVMFYRYTDVRAGITGTVVDPGEAIPNIETMLAYITAFSVCETYDSGKSYNRYNHVIYGSPASTYMWDSDTPSVAGTAPGSGSWVVTAEHGAAGTGAPSDDNPLMNGTAAPGTSIYLSRADHVHPSDTAKANVETITVNTDAAPALSTVATGNEYRCTNASPTTAPSLTLAAIASTSTIFGCVVVFKAPNTTAPVITNNSGYTLKYSGHGVSSNVFTPESGITYRMSFLFDGIYMNCYIVGV